jgi:hypothetical protein
MKCIRKAKKGHGSEAFAGKFRKWYEMEELMKPGEGRRRSQNSQRDAQ